MRRIFFTLAVFGVICAGRIGTAQPTKVLANIFVDNPGMRDMPLCVPLSVPEEFANLTNVPADGLLAVNVKFGATLQLTTPGLLTENIPPSGKGQVRRDLYLRLINKMDKSAEFKVYGSKDIDERVMQFEWKAKGKSADLLRGNIPLLCYVHAPYDNSTTANRDKTYKVFHHLFDPTGKRLLTNGGDTNDTLPKNLKDLLYPHHRGLMYAFNEITFDGNKKCDTWHAKPGDTHQSHEGFLVQEAGAVLGRHRVAVNWHGPKNEVFAKEERELTVYKMEKGTMVDFASRLKTTGGLVKLAGDPQHAGFQFRAHNDLHEQKNDKLTYYLRPDGKGKLGETRNWDPKKKGPVNLPWDAMSFVIDGKRYTVAYLNHPNNPGESRWSERDYGRFGCYFEYELTDKNPLIVNYRIWLQEGEMTVEEVEALHRAFTQPPKVTVR